MKKKEHCSHPKGERNSEDLLKLRGRFGCVGYAAYQLIKENQYDSSTGKLLLAAIPVVAQEWGIPDLSDIITFGRIEGIFSSCDQYYWIDSVLQDFRAHKSVDQDLHEKRAKAGRKGAEARARKFKGTESSSADDGRSVIVSPQEGTIIPRIGREESTPTSDTSPPPLLANLQQTDGKPVANFGKPTADFGKPVANFGKSAQPYNKESRESTIPTKISSSEEEEVSGVQQIRCIPYPTWTAKQFIILAEYYGEREGYDGDLLVRFINHWTGLAPTGKMLFQEQKSWSFENKLRNYQRVEEDIQRRVEAKNRAEATAHLNHGKIVQQSGPKLRKIGGGQDSKNKAS